MDNITYLPMHRGFLYLVAVMDWYSRKILAWKLSNTMHAEFCVSALQEAIANYGVPEIINTDQESQFTSLEFTSALKAHGIAISMDGKGCWRDNVFIERFWRTVKYEEIYLRAYECTSEARANLTRYLTFYNRTRPHSALHGQAPDQVYFASINPAALAAYTAGQSSLNPMKTVRRSGTTSLHRNLRSDKPRNRHSARVKAKCSGMTKC